MKAKTTLVCSHGVYHKNFHKKVHILFSFMLILHLPRQRLHRNGAFFIFENFIMHRKSAFDLDVMY